MTTQRRVSDALNATALVVASGTQQTRTGTAAGVGVCVQIVATSGRHSRHSALAITPKLLYIDPTTPITFFTLTK